LSQQNTLAKNVRLYNFYFILAAKMNKSCTDEHSNFTT